MSIIIGREEEQNLMMELFNSPRAEFLAMYGRRRIGKTFLIKNVYANDLLFYHTAKSTGNIGTQIDNWNESLIEYGFKGHAPKTWNDAFKMLRLLISKSKRKKKVVFIDEIPWLDNTDALLNLRNSDYYNNADI